MIAAGFVLLAIGAADLVRGFVPARRRWIGLLIGAVLLVVLGAFSNALVAAVGAVLIAAAWVWLSPVGAPARAGFWPAVVVGALCGTLVAAIAPRTAAGLIGEVWAVPTPFGVLTFDHAVLAIGAVVFLMESANVIVRTALQQENVQLARVAADAVPGTAAASLDPKEVDAAPAATGASRVSAPILSAPLVPDAVPAPVSPTPGIPAPGIPPQGIGGTEAAPVEPALKGGRLIGPLERIMVFALTLAVMYPLLAAVLAAKGIVRFPEISRDSAAGNRAEYFLIGSLVSWVIALAAAFLVWWAFATP